MTTMIVRHTVGSYDQWKKVYDEFAPTRKEKGVIGASVRRDVSDPNTLFVTHRFNNMNSATSFAESDELKSAMANAGVQGAPQIWFTEDIEQTPY